MADNSEKILKDLQQFNVQPPADAFDKAWEAIARQQDSVNLPNPPTENMEQKLFSSLQQYSMAAPPLDFDKLKKSKDNKTIRRIIPMAFVRAAALVLIVTTGAVLYFTVWDKKDTIATEYAAHADSIVQTKEVANITPVPAAKGEDKTAIKDPSYSSSLKTGKSKNIITAASKKSNNSNVSFSNGSFARLRDNDVLLTLTSYSSNDWQQFFTDAVKEKKIMLNEYSYMNLSDKMVDMLQQTYLTKKNGNPSRKAKKTKKKFEKWRKKDEKNFDKTMQKNPADITDLIDFIL